MMSNMEDVLEVYTRRDDPQYPLVCMGETSKQLFTDTREPLPAEPGQPQRVDYEYKREGVADMFMFFEPLTGKRMVKVTDQRTRKDWFKKDVGHISLLQVKGYVPNGILLQMQLQGVQQ
jgi:hypothetical protein